MRSLIASEHSAAAFAWSRRLIRDYLPAALLLALLVVGWELFVRIQDIRPYVLPGPLRVWDAFVDTRETLPRHAWTTLQEALIGLAWGAGLGLVLAALIASFALVRRVLYPVLLVTQTIPMIVLAPILVIGFGFGMTPKVIVVALIGFFPVCVSTADALLNADRELLSLVRSMGANRLQQLRIVLIPAAIPAFFAGLKIAAAYAVGGAVVAEWVGSSSGLGNYINRSNSSFRTDQVFVAVAIIALLTMALFAAVHIAGRIAAPWTTVEDGGKQ